ncbi:hypothetical protein V3O62_05645 [Streptomyces prasinus]
MQQLQVPGHGEEGERRRAEDRQVGVRRADRLLEVEQEGDHGDAGAQGDQMVEELDGVAPQGRTVGDAARRHLVSAFSQDEHQAEGEHRDEHPAVDRRAAGEVALDRAEGESRGHHEDVQQGDVLQAVAVGGVEAEVDGDRPPVGDGAVQRRSRQHEREQGAVGDGGRHTHLSRGDGTVAFGGVHPVAVAVVQIVQYVHQG